MDTTGTTAAARRQAIDIPTIVGLAALLLPLTTMWHEICGHAAACLLVGGRPSAIGAFYVDCVGDTGAARIVVACAGVFVDSLLSLAAWSMWRRARGDLSRLVLWYLWIGKGLVAAGYFCFSAVSGVGDLGPGPAGGIGPLPMPMLWRAGFLIAGGIAYWRLIVAGIAALTLMLGDASGTRGARRRIAHVYYAALGVVAVLVGLLNPVGLFITIMSAAASSFGGNAGLISIGYAAPAGDEERPFAIRRRYAIIVAGALVAAGFATVLGPTIRLRP